MPCSETICIGFYNVAHFHLTFFIRSLQMSDAFYKSSFFRNYLTLMWDGDASHGSQAFTSRDNIRRRKKQWIVNCIYRRL